MPYTCLFYHLIWSTKNRLPLITEDIEDDIYQYIKQKAHELGCKIFAVNGYIDHIHLVLFIPPKISVSETVKKLKGASSHEFGDIYWQRSYGVLTISENNLGYICEYVNNQKLHHQKQTTINRFEDYDENKPAKSTEKVE